MNPAAHFAEDAGGFFRFDAWISIDQPDTDFVVTVSEIGADGISTRLSSDVMRARYRESPRIKKLVTTTEPLRYEFSRFTFFLPAFNYRYKTQSNLRQIYREFAARKISSYLEMSVFVYFYQYYNYL